MMRWLPFVSIASVLSGGCAEHVDRPEPAVEGAFHEGSTTGAGTAPSQGADQAAAPKANDDCADATNQCLELQGLIRDYCFMCARCRDRTEPELDARCNYVPDHRGGRY